MNTKRVLSRLAISTLLAIFVVSMAFAPAGPGDAGPYIDELWYELIKTPDAQLTALLTHTVDIGGVPRPADLPTLRAAGFTITKTVRIGYTMFFENNLVYPTSEYSFRAACHRLIDKDYIVGNIYAPTMDKCEYYLPPPSQFINPDTMAPAFNPGSSPTETGTGSASSFLNEAGWTMTTTANPDYDSGDIWSAPYLRRDPGTGTVMDAVEFITRPSVESPLGYEMALFIAETFRKAGLVITIRVMTWAEMVPLLVDAELYDYQMLTGVGIVWGSTSPDILYDFLQSDQVPLWNCWHYFDEDADYWAGIMKSTLDINVFKQAAYELQELCVTDEPYLPLLLWNEYTAATGSYGAEPGVIALCNYKGSGAINNFWAIMNERRADPVKPIIKITMGAEMTTHNVLMANTVPDWRILTPVMGGTFALNPYTLDYWFFGHDAAPVQEVWAGPDNIPGNADDGMKTTVSLRDDLYWEDGTPVTAADWWFTMELLKHQNNVRYRSYWQNYYQTEVIDPYTFVEYATEQFIYRFESLDVGFLCPKHIWEGYIVPTYDGSIPSTGIYPTMIDSVNHHSAFQPWKEAYDSTPDPSEPETKLFGMGTFEYPMNSWQATNAYIRAFRDTWVGKICAGDVDLNQLCELPDLSLVLDAQGSYPGHPVWEGPDALRKVEMLGPAADIAAPSQQIVGAEISTVIGHFGHTWGPGIPAE